MSYAHSARLPKIQDDTEDSLGITRTGEKEFARRYSASSRSIFQGNVAKHREVLEPTEEVRDWYLDRSLLEDPDWWMFQKYRKRAHQAEKKQQMLAAESELPMLPDKGQEKFSRSSSLGALSLSGSTIVARSGEKLPRLLGRQGSGSSLQMSEKLLGMSRSPAAVRKS